MNKKDLSAIRKHFKIESERLNMGDIYNIYCNGNKKEVLYAKKEPFPILDEDVQEMYLKNFKKIITGAIDSKIFELDFNEDTRVNYQTHLLDLLNNRLDTNDVNALVSRLLEEYNYDTDVLISLVTCKIIMPIKNKKNDEIDEENDYSYEFVMCCVNKVQFNTPNLTLDMAEKEIKLDSNLSALAIKNPIEGFVYPVFNEGYVDVNKVLYNTSKANSLNPSFIKNVIGCVEKLTSEQEKEIFNNVLTSALGSKVPADTLFEVYEGLMTINADEDNEVSETICIKDLDRVLKAKGINELDTLKATLKNSDIDAEDFDFKVDNIIPQKSKAIKIKNNNVEISLSAKELDKIKQVENRGRKCLIIELDDDIDIEGFKLETEKI